MILSGGDARTILTFNGDPAQEAYERLEIACFRDRTKEFEFFELTFPGEARADLADLSAAERRQPVVISPPNGGPARDCRQCHQSPTRPNWESYNLWPANYGGLDDNLFRNGGARGPHPQVKAFDAAERAAFATFARTGRYAILNPLATEEPNTELGFKLSILNGQRIVAELARRGPRFERVKIDFAKALWCPTDLTADRTLGSAGLRMIARTPTDVEREIIAVSGDYGRSKLAALRDAYGVRVDTYPEPKLANAINAYYAEYGFEPTAGVFIQEVVDWPTVRKLAQMKPLVDPLGIDITNWSMILNGGYVFEDGVRDTFTRSLELPVLQTFFPRDERLKDLLIQRRTIVFDENAYANRRRADQAICDHLTRP